MRGINGERQYLVEAQRRRGDAEGKWKLFGVYDDCAESLVAGRRVAAALLGSPGRSPYWGQVRVRAIEIDQHGRELHRALLGAVGRSGDTSDDGDRPGQDATKARPGPLLSSRRVVGRRRAPRSRRSRGAGLGG